MTVHAKANPVGLDRQLYKIQQKLDAINWNNIEVYGKMYVNKSGNDTIAEAYVASGEYKEVFIDDRETAVFGFFVGDNRSGLNMIRVPVELVCSCRLDKIYDSTERKDEEALLTVHKIIKKHTFLANEGEIRTGLENVFSRVSTERLKFRDMQPWFNFSIGFDVIYKNET